jgi:hypothetical protein
VHHERAETAPHRSHAQRLVNGRVIDEKQYRVHVVQFFQFSKEMEHTCNNKLYTPIFYIGAVVQFIII